MSGNAAEINSLSEVESFLNQAETLPMFIDGQWVSPEGCDTIDVLDPSNGKKLTQLYAGNSSHVDQACQAAHKAFQSSGWATMAKEERADILFKLADLLEENVEVLAVKTVLNVLQELSPEEVASINNYRLSGPINAVADKDLFYKLSF